MGNGLNEFGENLIGTHVVPNAFVLLKFLTGGGRI